MRGACKPGGSPRLSRRHQEGEANSWFLSRAVKKVEPLGFLGPAAGKGPRVEFSVTKLPSSLLCSPSPHTGPGAPSPLETTVHQIERGWARRFEQKLVAGGGEGSVKENSVSSASCLHIPGTNCPQGLGLKRLYSQEVVREDWLSHLGPCGVLQGSESRKGFFPSTLCPSLPLLCSTFSDCKFNFYLILKQPL